MQDAKASFTPATYYHVYNHAIGDSHLFRAPENYRYFLAQYASYMAPLCQTYAYCLMPNHFHIVLKVREREALLRFCRSILDWPYSSFHSLLSGKKAT